MESPAEQSSQSTTSSEPMNWTTEMDRSTKRKSVSSGDEKMILDALNSTNSTTNGNKSKGGKHNYHQQHSNGRSNGYSRGHGPSSGDSANGGYSKRGSKSEQAATNGGAKNNAVIVYYSDPQSEINVDQLLTTTKTTESEKNGVNGSGGHLTNGCHSKQNNNGHFVPKSGGHTNGHHQRDHQRDHQHRQHRQNGGDDRREILSNGHSPSKFADNWRTKGLRMDQPQYQPVRERIGNGHFEKHSGGGNKPNGRQQHHQPKSGMPQLQPASTTNGKVSGTFPKLQQQKQPSVTPPKQSAPITIYYTTPECSTDVIEQNLKQLQLKQKTDSNSENNPADNGETALKDEAPTPSASTSSTTSTTSQENVIKSEKESDSDAKSTSQEPASTSHTATSSAVPTSMPITLTTSTCGDQYDVINGGVPIEAAKLPTESERHPIRCTLVSHPGHFYIKFVDEASEAVLATMNEFYSQEEHLIELSVELLRPGQYFAACRPRPPTATREWIRVQLQSVEGPELINCLLIDEGCFGIFKCGDLQPLYNQFRVVAKRAVRASLSGVIPKDIDWLPQQSLDFKKLVSDRPLHSGTQVFDQTAFEEKGYLQLELYFADGDDGLKDRSVADVVVERDIASKK